jgi:hypothetical protein
MINNRAYLESLKKSTVESEQARLTRMWSVAGFFFSLVFWFYSPGKELFDLIVYFA